MADQTNQAHGRGDHGRNDEPDRPKAARGPALADEGSDDLPALLVIAVGIAVIVVLLLQSGFNVPGLTPSTVVAGSAGGDDSAAEAEEAEAAAEEGEEVAEDVEEEAVVEELDLAALNGELAAAGITGITLAATGGELTATGEVADEAARAEVLELLGSLPGVERVIDELTIAEAAAGPAAVTVEASQAAIVLSGIVPSQAIADELNARALQFYRPEQVDNQLVVDEAATPPITVTLGGATTDQALFNGLTTAFDGIVGIDAVDATGLALEQSSDLEAALLALPLVEFASGSAQILPESATILDQVATLLAEDPSVTIEIGGHTDSRGSAESNQTLSQARADAVQAALIERGVLNDMVARGFGEDRLKVNPEVTPEDQQANRRIEFRIL